MLIVSTEKTENVRLRKFPSNAVPVRPSDKSGRKKGDMLSSKADCMVGSGLLGLCSRKDFENLG